MTTALLFRRAPRAYTDHTHPAAVALDVRQWPVRCVFPTAWPERVEPVVLPAIQGQSRVIAEIAPITGHGQAGLLRSVVSAFLCLFAPDTCRICDRRLVHTATYPMCSQCLAAVVPLQSGSCCTMCNEPLAPDAVLFGAADDHLLCEACSSKPPCFARAISYALYEDVREAVHLLKFEGVVSLAKPLGGMLANAILQHLPQAHQALVVVPVPLFRGKRRFNQSTLLAQEALRQLRRVAPTWALQLKPELLRRTRHTESQYLLSPTERRSNLRGAFCAHTRVKGRHILLVDDIYTTGTTAQECTRTLLAAGAATVRVATLARAGRDTAMMWKPSLPSTPQAPVSSSGSARLPGTSL